MATVRNLVTPKVSVIVPVRDDAVRLGQLIELLAGQTLQRDHFEVLVGDDGSVDLDPAEVETQDGWLRVVRQPPRNSFAARNLAVSRSRGDVIAFSDADCEPEPDWLERGLEALEGADIVGGLVRFRLDGRPRAWGLIDMETFLDQERNVRGGGILTANVFVRRSLFEKVGGFDESLALGGDIAFAHACRSHGRLAFAESAVVWHPPRASGRSLLSKIWGVEYAYAYRYARDGKPRPPLAATWRTLLPVPGVVRIRLRARTLGLNHALLRSKGARPRLRDDLSALPLLYLVIPYVRAAAQTFGWWKGRGTRSSHE